MPAITLDNNVKMTFYVPSASHEKIAFLLTREYCAIPVMTTRTSENPLRKRQRGFRQWRQRPRHSLLCPRQLVRFRSRKARQSGAAPCLTVNTSLSPQQYKFDAPTALIDAVLSRALDPDVKRFYSAALTLLLLLL